MKNIIFLASTFFLAGFIAAPAVMAGSWQEDDLTETTEVTSSKNPDWQIGVRLDVATRGVDGVGGFVSDDPVASQSLYVWSPKYFGLYVQAQNSNSLNSEDDFGDSRAYSVGLYHEIAGDLFVDIGYKYNDLWDVGRGLNTDFHSVYGGVYLPRFGATNWSDGIRLYAEAQNFWPSDSSIMTMGGGLEYKIGVKTKLLVFQDLMPNGLDVDLSGGGNNGIFGRQSDVFGFAMLKVSTKYEMGESFSVTPYAIGVTQSRPGEEENESIGIVGISAALDFIP